MKCDQRPQRYGWASGGYMKYCLKCSCRYAGDKRSSICADCAYAMPDPHQETPPNPQSDIPPEAEERIKTLENRLKQFEEILPIIINGERRGYIDGPEQYFAALKKAWALLEEKP